MFFRAFGNTPPKVDWIEGILRKEFCILCIYSRKLRYICEEHHDLRYITERRSSDFQNGLGLCQDLTDLLFDSILHFSYLLIYPDLPWIVKKVVDRYPRTIWTRWLSNLFTFTTSFTGSHTPYHPWHYYLLEIISNLFPITSSQDDAIFLMRWKFSSLFSIDPYALVTWVWSFQVERW